MKSVEEPRYSLGEEITNSVTHGIGAALSIAGLSVLVALASVKGDPWRITAFSIYGSSLVLLYAASTLYHSISSPSVKRFLRRFDHAAIFLLIAGTYTPFVLVTLRGAVGWTLFAIVWALAVFGVVLKVGFTGRFELIGILLYVGMGWSGITAIKPILAALPPWGFAWILLGGLAYTFGVVFYVCKKIPYNHAIWHVFVLTGSVCHFVAIGFFVLP